MTGTRKNYPPGTPFRFIFLVWIIILGGCDVSPANDEALEQGRRETAEEFSRKKICADYGRAELAHLIKENDSAGQPQIFVDATSEWCFNKKFNTCLFITMSRTFIVSFQGKAEPLGESVWKIKNLLTNADVVSLSGKELENPSLTEQFFATKERLCPQFPAN